MSVSKTFTSKERQAWIESWPRKAIISKVLLRNSRNQLLIVKPDYKDSWVFPGGGVNKGESPKGAAVRETFEEVGINLNYKDLELAEILFDKKFDSLTLIYLFKNILDDEVKLNLQKDEIDDYQFRDATELMELLPVHYSKFIDNRLQSIITNIS